MKAFKAIILLGFTYMVSASLSAHTTIPDAAPIQIETSSFQTSSQQTVAIGDSLSQLIQRTGQSPQAIKSVPWISHGLNGPAMQYDYQIGDYVYTVTVVEEQVRKIQQKSNIQ